MHAIGIGAESQHAFDARNRVANAACAAGVARGKMRDRVWILRAAAVVEHDLVQRIGGGRGAGIEGWMVIGVIETRAGRQSELAVATQRVSLRNAQILFELDQHAFQCFKFGLAGDRQGHGFGCQRNAAAADGDRGRGSDLRQRVGIAARLVFRNLAFDLHIVAGFDVGSGWRVDKQALRTQRVLIGHGLLNEEALELVVGLEVAGHHAAHGDKLIDERTRRARVLYGGDVIQRIGRRRAGWQRNCR